MPGNRIDTVDPEPAANRAAGQAVAATIVGAPLIRASIEGVELGRPTSDVRRPRAEIISDIMIGLAGIAARNRYRFGDPGPNIVVVCRIFDDTDRRDWAEVQGLVRKVDRDGDQDILFFVWRYALDLIAAPDVRSAVDAVARAVQVSPINAAEVMSQCFSAAVPARAPPVPRRTK